MPTFATTKTGTKATTNGNGKPSTTSSSHHRTVSSRASGFVRNLIGAPDDKEKCKQIFLGMQQYQKLCEAHAGITSKKIPNSTSAQQALESQQLEAERQKVEGDLKKCETDMLQLIQQVDLQELNAWLPVEFFSNDQKGMAEPLLITSAERSYFFKNFLLRTTDRNGHTLNVNICGSSGKTPLHVLLQAKKTLQATDDLDCLLNRKDVALGIPSHDGKTPLYLCIENRELWGLAKKLFELADTRAREVSSHANLRAKFIKKFLVEDLNVAGTSQKSENKNLLAKKFESALDLIKRLVKKAEEQWNKTKQDPESKTYEDTYQDYLKCVEMYAEFDPHTDCVLIQVVYVCEKIIYSLDILQKLQQEQHDLTRNSLDQKNEEKNDVIAFLANKQPRLAAIKAEILQRQQTILALLKQKVPYAENALNYAQKIARHKDMPIVEKLKLAINNLEDKEFKQKLFVTEIFSTQENLNLLVNLQRDTKDTIHPTLKRIFFRYWQYISHRQKFLEQIKKLVNNLMQEKRIWKRCNDELEKITTKQTEQQNKLLAAQAKTNWGEVAAFGKELEDLKAAHKKADEEHQKARAAYDTNKKHFHDCVTAATKWQQKQQQLIINDIKNLQEEVQKEEKNLVLMKEQLDQLKTICANLKADTIRLAGEENPEQLYSVVVPQWARAKTQLSNDGKIHENRNALFAKGRAIIDMLKRRNAKSLDEKADKKSSEAKQLVKVNSLPTQAIAAPSIDVEKNVPPEKTSLQSAAALQSISSALLSPQKLPIDKKIQQKNPDEKQSVNLNGPPIPTSLTLQIDVEKDPSHEKTPTERTPLLSAAAAQSPSATPLTPQQPPVDGKAEKKNSDAKQPVNDLLAQALEEEKCYLQTKKAEDAKKVFQAYSKLAEEKHKEGQYKLARCYQLGIGCDKSADKANKYFSLAAAQNHGDACYYWGLAEYNKKDFIKAFDLFSRAASLNSVLGKFNVAVCHENGHGVAKNFDTAFTLYLELANSGDAASQYTVGKYYKGDPKGKSYGKVKINPVEARSWFERAAGQGHVKAQEELKLLPPPAALRLRA